MTRATGGRRLSQLDNSAAGTAAAVVAVSDDDFAKLRTSSHISDAVAVVAGALCMLMNQPPSWRQAVAIMSDPDFRKKVLQVGVCGGGGAGNR